MTRNKKDLIILGVLGTVTVIPAVLFLCILVMVGLSMVTEYLTGGNDDER